MNFENILIVDTETTGIDPKVDVAIEVGLVLYSVRLRTIRECFSVLIKHDSNAAVHVNRIPVDALADGRDREKAMSVVKVFAKRADCIVAHNAEFDKGFLPDLGKPWVCSCFDIDWPGHAKETSPTDEPRVHPGRSLVATCLDYGIGVASAHRALTDCLLLARLFDRVAEMGHDVNAILTHGMRPKAKFWIVEARKGVGNKYDPKKNDVYKMYGFKWNDPDWVRTMAYEDAEYLPFEVKVLEEIK